MRKSRKIIDIYTGRGVHVITVKGEPAAASFCKVSQPAVSQHLHGKIRTCGGFVLKEREE